MLGHHRRIDAAAHQKLGGQAHEARVRGLDQVVEDPVGDVLVEGAFLAEGPDVELQGLEFHAARIGHVVQLQGGEVRLAGLGAQAGELRHGDVDGVIPARVGIFEGF